MHVVLTVNMSGVIGCLEACQELFEGHKQNHNRLH